MQQASYGTWRSPITAAGIAAGEISLGQVAVSGGAVYWVESRPQEKGRMVLVRRGADGRIADVTPPGFSVHSRVHEYGGGAYCLHNQTVSFSNSADQRLYHQPPGVSPRPITPEPPAPAALRYADGRVRPDGRLLICVRESHGSDGQVINDLVALHTDGSSVPLSIASGRDFYAAPRINPDGTRLCWLAWDAPQMPWDGCELWAADLGPDGSLSNADRVAGGRREAIFQPEWSPAGELYYVSDVNGWWNLYRAGDEEPLAPIEADCGEAAWTFGAARYAFLSGGRIAVVYAQAGFDHLGLITPGDGGIEPISAPFTSYHRAPLVSDGERLFAVAGSPEMALAVVEIDPGTGAARMLRSSSSAEIEPEYISRPEPITFPGGEDRPTHALFYPPANAAYSAPPGELPPLIVIGHGGPTAATSTHLRPAIQFWTSRGFAVVDVNYSGSTGYGRLYRDRLRGKWGVLDVADCVKAARYLVAQGRVDGKRLLVRGGSAGGYMALCALTFYDDFAAGASYYGVSDLSLLAETTHKFEAHYMETLVGPYPAAKAVYMARSPLVFADRIDCPIIFFQGLEDRVVPPSQAEALVEVMRRRGLRHAYLTFAGEGHGFQQADNIRRSLEAELSFYAQVLGLSLSEPIEPVVIES